MTSELTTPDGRYFVLQGRLWRASNPTLAAERKVKYMRDLLNGRRALKAAKLAGDEAAITAARHLVAADVVRAGEPGARPLLRRVRAADAAARRLGRDRKSVV